MGMEIRKCIRCGHDYPIDRYRLQKRNGKEYRGNVCAKCRNEECNIRRRAKSPKEYTCKRCGQTKPTSAYRPIVIKEGITRHAIICLECEALAEEQEREYVRLKIEKRAKEKQAKEDREAIVPTRPPVERWKLVLAPGRTCPKCGSGLTIDSDRQSIMCTGSPVCVYRDYRG